MAIFPINEPKSIRTRATGDGSSDQSVAPPLLPAFLITGLLLGIIVIIILWRHCIERQHTRGEGEDPTWQDGPFIPEAEPILWEVYIKRQAEGKLASLKWDEVMPVSVMPRLRAKPKLRQPRYLVPSDSPISFWTRMFGTGWFGLGTRQEPSVVQQGEPHTSPTNAMRETMSLDSNEGELIDGVQVTVLIALPQNPRAYTEQMSELGMTADETPPKIFQAEGEDGQCASSGATGHGFSDENSDESPQVSLGTIVLPYSEYS